jgi:mono/diheme cytochrome c family protein
MTPSVPKLMLAPLAAAVLAGCALQIQNTQPAQELAAERTRPPGSAEIGWRVYEDKCARCHGAAATGSGSAPDLLGRTRQLGQRQFVNLVLRRYESEWPTPPPAAEGPAREAALDAILQRRSGMFTMPAWQGKPRVEAHVLDLYTYLAARAEGKLGPGPPAP